MTFNVVYMQSVGYSNTALGIILSCGNVLGSIIGPKFASMASRGKAKNSTLVYIALLAQIITYLTLFSVNRAGALFSMAYVLQIAFCYTVNNMDLEMYADSLNRGFLIDYGIARGCGSLAFVFTSFFLGRITDAFGTRALAVCGLFVVMLSLLSHLWFSRAVSGSEATGGAGGSEESQGKSTPIGKFLLGNKLYAMVLLGIIVLMIGYRISISFMVNIVRNVGGDVKLFSVITSLQAFVEIPFMVFYSRLFRRFKPVWLLAVSFVFYIAKLLLMALAGNITTLILATLLQGPSYALYNSAVVDFTTQVVDPRNRPVAQSLTFTTTTISYVFSGVFGGLLFDNLSVRNAMLVCALFCVVGVLLCSPNMFALHGRSAGDR